MPDGKLTYSSGNDKSYKICLGLTSSSFENIVSKLERRRSLDLYLSSLLVEMLSLIIVIILAIRDKNNRQQTLTQF